MLIRVARLVLVLLAISFISLTSYGQDIDFHINAHFLAGKKILKLKRDFGDPYVWILAENNGVYRINSLTKAVEDLTAAFSAYNGLQFIDIAGYSQAEVFIATNTSVIGYKNGQVKEVATQEALKGEITSIGLTNDVGVFGPGILLIGTTHGLGRYEVASATLSYYTYALYFEPVKIFTSTYRGTMLTDENVPYWNTAAYPVLFSQQYNAYSYYILDLVESGGKINTAFYVPGGILNPIRYGGSFIWGNEYGLYQESMGYNGGFDPLSFHHFLDNVNVNKITDILGLTSFYSAYDPIISKDNLLVGTDNGLYFSSSLSFNFFEHGVATFVMYHYDALGNVKVNDVCVNATGRSVDDIATSCENGVWVATDDGLYLLDPDFLKNFDTSQLVKALTVDNPLSDPLTTLDLCSGNTMKMQLNGNYTQGNTIQWRKDGKDIVGETGASLTVSEAGNYSAIFYSSCSNVHLETNHIQVKTIPGPVFAFDYPDKLQRCSSDPITLQTDNNPIYQYRWYRDGVLNNETSSSLKVYQSGKYKVEVSACTDTWVASKEVEVDLIDLPTPQVTSAKNTYCEGDEATVSIDIPADPAYTINWYKNGNLIAGDKDLTSIKATADGDYSVALTSTIADCSRQSLPFKLTFISAPVFTFNYQEKLQFCDVASTTLKVDDNPIYQYRWYKDGTLTGDITSTLNVTKTGKYKVELSACTGSWVASKEVQVDLVHLPVPEVTVDKPIYCAGAEANLSLNIPADAAYTINWYKNGNLIVADKDMTAIKATTDGSYSVVISSTVADCAKPSQPVQVAFTPAPVFTFNYPNELRYCDGTPVTLQVTGPAAYQYRWYKDGVLTGDVTAALAITKTGRYMVEVSSCEGSWVPSKAVQVELVKLPVPVITTDKPAFCVGGDAKLSIATPVSSGYTINWYNGGTLINSNTNLSALTTNIGGNYSVSITSNNANSDGSFCSQESAVKTIVFSPPPTVSVEEIVTTTLCAGQLIDLKATYNGGTVKWSTGETTDKISVSAAGSYKATVTSVAGCTAEASIDVSLLPLPVFTMENTSICSFKQQTVTLTAPSGFSAYAWNGVSGNQTYDVTRPQTVSLTVTDANGCQATRQIVVADQCPQVIIPNTFTPNGDGVNDTWAIAGLESDPTATVKVFNRNGIEVYESRGYETNWNGQYHSKKLPAGVYYYIITAKNSAEKFSGYVTMLY